MISIKAIGTIAESDSKAMRGPLEELAKDEANGEVQPFRGWMAEAA